MSYQDFINFISNGVDIFIDGLKIIANNLSKNYFFITICGLALFIIVFNIILIIKDSILGKANDLIFEEKKEKKKNRKLTKKEIDKLLEPSKEAARKEAEEWNDGQLADKKELKRKEGETFKEYQQRIRKEKEE